MTLQTGLPETAAAMPTVQSDVSMLATGVPVPRTNQPKIKWIAHAVLIVVCAVAIIPFLWMLSTSLKTGDNAVAMPPQYIPHPFQWSNYWQIFHHEHFNLLLSARNTLIITTLVVLGTTISSAIVA